MAITLSGADYVKFSKKDRHILETFGYVLNCKVESSTSQSEVSDSMVNMSRTVAEKMSDNLKGATLTPNFMRQLIDAERASLEPQLIADFSNKTPDELLLFATKYFPCKKDIKSAFATLGESADEIFASDPERWKEIALPIILAKRQYKIDNPSYAKDQTEPHVSTVEVLCNCATQLNPTPNPQTRQDMKQLLLKNVVYMLYLKKSTWSLSQFAMTRNLSILDKMYGKGFVASGAFYSWLQQGLKLIETPQPEDSGERKESSNIAGYAVDGAFNIEDITKQMRTVDYKCIARTWTAPDASIFDIANFGNLKSFVKPIESSETATMIEDFRVTLLAQPEYGTDWAALYGRCMPMLIAKCNLQSKSSEIISALSKFNYDTHFSF